MWKAFTLTVLVEPVMIAFFYRDRWAIMALVAFVATASTHLAMHWVLPSYIADIDTRLFVGEIGALLLEALAYWAFDPRHRAGLALMASASANTASFLFGIALLPWLF